MSRGSDIENKDLGIYGLEGIVRKIYPKAFSKVSELHRAER